MSRTNRHSWRMLACFFATTLLLSAGCRQLGNRSSQGAPTLLGPSAPAYAPPGESSGPPVLRDIPPLPPSAASTFNPAAYGSPRRLGWSQPRHAPRPPTLDSYVFAEGGVPIPGKPAATSQIQPASAEDTTAADDGNDLAALLPPGVDDVEEGLVPPPRDVDDEFEPHDVSELKAALKVVEIDLTEFLAELEQAPSLIRAQTQSEPILMPVIATTPVVTGPVAVASSPQAIAPWPNGQNHGIAINPGPTGTGNRLELFPGPALPWNAGRVAAPYVPPAWSSMNSWAGQNSDWDGRQFR